MFPLISLKTSENKSFSDVFRGIKKENREEMDSEKAFDFYHFMHNVEKRRLIYSDLIVECKTRGVFSTLSNI